MNRTFVAGLRRFAVSALIAIPITVALLFLMTRLILPGEHDPIVTRMIRNIELRRAVPPPEPVAVPAYRPPVEDNALNTDPAPAVERAGRRPAVSTDEGAAQETPVRPIDWEAEIRSVTREPEEQAIKRWLLEQGHEPYVSIMQGPLPITNSVRGELPITQEDITGYMNTFGDMEIKVGKYCVAQTQVSARLDMSDFAEKLPMRILCKSPPAFRFPFDDGYRE